MPAHLVLQTWKEISEYVGRTERTLQRWEQQFGFPVHRPSGKSRSSVMALTEEIQEWARGKPSIVVIRRTARLSRAELAGAPVREHNFTRDVSQWPVPELVVSKTLQAAVLERLRLSGLLWKEQKNLRAEVKHLLQEQRRLRENIRRSQQCKYR